MSVRRILTSALLLSFLSSSTYSADRFDPKPLDIGATAPDFSLPGTDDKTHSLADYKSSKLLLVIFTTNHCPTANAYEDRIIQLHNDYANKGVALVAINPNDPNAVRLDELGYTDLTDDLPSMKLRAKEKNFPYPYLYDGDTQSVAKAYGCLATPHVFLFDADRKLRYTGRIDDSEVKEPKSHDLRNALDALLAGKQVPVAKTKVVGCSTKWSFKRDDVAKYFETVNAEPVTLTDIDLPALQKLVKNEDSDKLRVINFWASWCGDCIGEMPELVTMNRMYRRRPFEFVTVSIDDPADRRKEALALSKELHLSNPNHLFTGDRDAMMKTIDPQWEGPIPHTLIVAPGGKVLYRHTGAIDPLEVKRIIVNHIGRTYANTTKAR